MQGFYDDHHNKVKIPFKCSIIVLCSKVHTEYLCRNTCSMQRLLQSVDTLARKVHSEVATLKINSDRVRANGGGRLLSYMV